MKTALSTHGRMGAVLGLVLSLAAFPAALHAAQTGDDDDIDDLIIQRGEKRSADRASNKSGTRVTPETEDDLYVGNKPAANRVEGGATRPSRTDDLQGRPVRDARTSAKAVGKVSPEAGRWNTFATLTGPGFGKAERVAVVWYPNDDDARPPAGSISATVRKRLGADGLEIEIPRNAGGANGGVVRLLVFTPSRLQPLLAGRFRVE